MAATLIPPVRLSQAIGRTPLVELGRVAPVAAARVLAKAEFLNPSGSIKDRIARHIVERAEARGELRPGSVILEVTSGNTGIALALVGAERGYRVRILMPASASPERRRMIEGLGAELELIGSLLHINDARCQAEERAARDPHIFLPRQFSNPDNVEAHRLHTGREIVEDLGPHVDAFVMGVGTGGTLMGVAEALRRVNPRVQIVAVEPAESAVLSGGEPGHHGIQGLADGFIPEIVDQRKIDRVITVRTEEAIAMARRLAKEEGLFVGISAGANVLAANLVARELGRERTVVTILPDRGERYFSVWEEENPSSPQKN